MIEVTSIGSRSKMEADSVAIVGRDNLWWEVFFLVRDGAELIDGWKRKRKMARLEEDVNA
jgi:hypothetical protein